MNTILLSPVGGRAISGIIEYFKNKNYTIIGIDSDSDAIGRHFVDLFFEVPHVGTPLYKERVIDIIKSNKIDVFISWLDPEIVFWNDQYYHNGIPEEFLSIFTINYRRDINNFFDKYLFSCLVEKQGFVIPNTLLAMEDISDDRYPIIIKPRLGFGSKGVRVVKSKRDYESFLLEITKNNSLLNGYISQHYIKGQEYTVDFFSESGEIINYVVRKRNEHQGVSLKGEIVENYNLEKIIRAFSKKNNINGLNNIQFIQNEGSYYLTDFNMRPSGTIMFSVTSGVDMFENIFEKIRGDPLTHYGKPKKIKMIRYLKEHYYE